MMKCQSDSRRNEYKGLTGVVVTALLVAALLGSCSSRDPRLQGVLSMEGQSAQPPSRERIAELQETIDEYEQVVNQKVEAAMRQASYLKLLAQEYMRQELYGPALDALEEALVIEPRNTVLHQLAGVCAGYVAKAQARPERRAELFAVAEQFYKQSLEIDPNYVDGLYALANLYHFEMGKHLEAIEALDRLLELSPSHTQALFVLARSHAALGDVDDAVAAYDRIIEMAANREAKEQARRNRQLLLGELE